MKTTLIRHAIALLATLAVLVVSPFLAGVVSSRLSRLLQEGDGFHVYALTWSSGKDGDLEDAGAVVNPIGPGLAVLVVGIMIICIVGEALRRKWSPLSWAFPFLVSLLVGMWMTFLISGGEAPADAPITIGITVGLLALVLVGTYWWTLRAMSLRTPQRAR
jgi:hypothetical protein